MCSCVLSGLCKSRFGRLVASFRFRQGCGGMKVSCMGGGKGLPVLSTGGGVWSKGRCWLVIRLLGGLLSRLSLSRVYVWGRCASGEGSMVVLLCGIAVGIVVLDKSEMIWAICGSSSPVSVYLS
jgi:hypothetical protein